MYREVRELHGNGESLLLHLQGLSETLSDKIRLFESNLSEEMDEATAEQVAQGEEPPDTLGSALKKLDDEMTCAVCQEHYRDPKLLPTCGHYFCRVCIDRLVRYAKAKQASCPICSKPIIVPEGGVDALPSAFFLAGMRDVLEAINKRKTDLRQRDPTCDLCHRGKVDTFCRNCDQFLCSDCAQTHHTMAHFARHKLLSLDEVERWKDIRRPLRSASITSRYSLAQSDSLMSSFSTVSSAGRSDGKRPRRMMCVKHDDPIKIYCFDCDQLICRDCTVYDHRDHNHEFLKECAPRIRQGLSNSLRPLQKARDNITAAQKEVDHIEGQVEEQEASLAESVKESFHQVRAYMDTCEAVMLQSLKRVAQSKRDALSDHREMLQMVMTEVSDTLASVESEIESASNEDIMSQQKALYMDIDKKLARHQRRSLEPPTTADMVCSAPTPNSFPVELGLIFAESDLCHLQVTPPAVSTVGKPLEYHIKVPHVFGGVVELELHSLINASCLVQAQVTHVGENVQLGVVVDKYQVKFTPRVRGRHHLKVKINGMEIPGSPFNVFAKIDPTHLGSPLRKSEELGKPFGIALSPDGELVITENGGKTITYMDRHSMQPLRVIVDAKLYYPRGIAVAADGTVFTADKGTFHPQKLREYTVMKFVNMRLVKGINYGSLTVCALILVNNRLYVCDRKPGQVHVLSLDLDLIFTFNTPKTPEPHAITEHNGYLYIAGGAEKGCPVSIYDLEGKFIGNVPIKVPLYSLRGICFDKNDNMFLSVGGGGSEGIYVFKTNGNYVTSFGVGMIDQPVGIVIDKDGFVFVVDHKEVNRRIFVF